MNLSLFSAFYNLSISLRILLVFICALINLCPAFTSFSEIIQLDPGPDLLSPDWLNGRVYVWITVKSREDRLLTIPLYLQLIFHPSRIRVGDTLRRRVAVLTIVVWHPHKTKHDWAIFFQRREKLGKKPVMWTRPKGVATLAAFRRAFCAAEKNAPSGSVLFMFEIRLVVQMSSLAEQSVTYA